MRFLAAISGQGAVVIEVEGFVFGQGSVLPIGQGIVGANEIDDQMLDADLLVCQAADVEWIEW